MLLFNKSTKIIGTLLCFLSLISGLSRVFVGVHFPLDILSAILVAIFSSMIVFKLQYKISLLLNYLVQKMPNKPFEHDF
jgi:undecaprenyl-diphosphatase